MASAALARVDHFCAVGASGARIEDVDDGAAFAIVVGIGRVLHHGDGEGDDVVGVVAHDAAGSHPRAIIGDVPLVGEGGVDKKEEREDEGE